MSLVHNEQTKLTATWLNGVAIAGVAVGGIAPIVTVFVGSSTPNTVPVVLSSLAWVSIGTGLHFIARTVLRRLQP